MSLFYVPGPCQISVGTGASSALEFLGWSEDGVEGRIQNMTQEVMADYAGPMAPADVQWFGSQAFITLTLSKYNEAILQKILKLRNGASATVGAVEANGMGSLMVSQGFSFKLLLYSSYSGLAYQSPTAVPCYLFNAAWLHEEYKFRLSARVKQPQLVFRAITVWDSVALTGVLYTNTPPGSIPATD